ncbi:MAG: hypothetical protein ACFE95_02630 [Candidatus Hodarchaeota archaeon]
MKEFDKKYFQDGWSWTHLMGCGLAHWLSFFIVKLSLTQSFIVAPVPTLLKELGDQIAKKYQIEWMFKVGFDKTGFDYRDCAMALVGVIIATLIILIGGIS